MPTRARGTLLLAVHAVQAVVLAGIGEEDLQQRDAAPVGRIAVADAGAFVGTQATAAAGVTPDAARRRTGGVVLGGVGKDGELGGELNCMNIQYRLSQQALGPALHGAVAHLFRGAGQASQSAAGRGGALVLGQVGGA